MAIKNRSSMEENKRVCIIIPVYNRLEKTKKLINELEKSTYKKYQIVIVDDNSTDGTSEYFKSNKKIILLKGDGNKWWSGSTNLGVKYAIENNYDFVLTLNNDSIPKNDFIDKLVNSSKFNPDCLIGGRIMWPEKQIVWALGVNVDFIKFPFLELNLFGKNVEYINQLERYLYVDALTGNGTLIPVNVFKRIGFYDEKWCPQYHGDTEFSYRAKMNGFKCLIDNHAILDNYNYEPDPKFSIAGALINKKSPYYWRPIFIFYYRYAPLILKLFYFKQLLWIPKRIVKRLIKK